MKYLVLIRSRGGHRIGAEIGADDVRGIVRIIAGASIAALVGSSMYLIHSGTISFLITTGVTLVLIHLCKWNAAPILAVSIIPFFSHPTTVWMLPLAVLASLVGIMVPMWMVGRLEQSNWLHLIKGTMGRLIRGRSGVKQDF